MISGIGSGIGSAQALRALQAFKADENIIQKNNLQVEENKEEFDLSFNNSNDILRNDISQMQADDIKQVAKTVETDLSNADINYGMTYGRSVIVDYSA